MRIKNQNNYAALVAHTLRIDYYFVYYGSRCKMTPPPTAPFLCAAKFWDHKNAMFSRTKQVPGNKKQTK